MTSCSGVCRRVATGACALHVSYLFLLGHSYLLFCGVYFFLSSGQVSRNLCSSFCVAWKLERTRNKKSSTYPTNQATGNSISMSDQERRERINVHCSVCARASSLWDNGRAELGGGAIAT